MSEASPRDNDFNTNSLPVILVGIDWADCEHEFMLAGPDGEIHRGSFDQESDAVADFLKQWRKQFGLQPMAIAVETNNGPLINALMEHDDVTIYPVNPAALASYREAFAHGGGKNDKVDAALILQYLTHYRSQLKPLRQDSPPTRLLAALVRDRRQVVEQRVALSLQLKSLLKAYFPAVLHMKAAKPYAEFLLRLIAKYPTLAAAKKAGRPRIRKLFYGLGSTIRTEERIEALFTAQPLTTDEVVLNTSSRKVQLLARQLLLLNQAIRDYDREIRQALNQHPQASVVDSLPCGVTSKARIIAALGDDKQRYPSATELNSAVGIAPITTQSGKSRYVSSRWATSKFLRQTFHEFAGVTIKRCPWSKAFYDSQLANGKTTRMAKRALAYKWIRIIYRCWQSDTPYDQQKYMQRLIQTQSPLARKLPA
jgi:transposase